MIRSDGPGAQGLFQGEAGPGLAVGVTFWMPAVFLFGFPGSSSHAWLWVNIPCHKSPERLLENGGVAEAGAGPGRKATSSE